MTIAELVKEFLSFHRVLHKAKTVKTYEDRLKLFVKLYGTMDINLINHKLLTQFVEQASHSPKKNCRMSPTTIRMSITVVRNMLGFAFRRQYIALPITFDVRMPKDNMRERIPTRREQRKLIKIAPRPFRRIFQALRLSGARPKELCEANIEDYDLARHLIILIDHKTAFQTGKVRKIGVGQKLSHILRFAIGNRTSGPIFLTSKGNRWNTEVLSHKYAVLRDRVGLPKDLCLYAATRHEHGTRMTNKHGIFAASQSLGHADIKTTMRYAHITDKQLKRNQDDL